MPNAFTNKKLASEAGKKKGKHKKTLEWEQLGEFITDAGAERFKKIMLQSNDKTFTEMYLKALNYFKPKMQHVMQESEQKVIEPIEFIVNKK